MWLYSLMFVVFLDMGAGLVGAFYGKYISNRKFWLCTIGDILVIGTLYFITVL